MNYGGSRRSGPSTSTSSIARANAYGASSSNPNFAYGCTRPKTPNINYNSYPFSNGAGTGSNQRLPPPGSCTGSSANSRNSPNNRSPYAVYANTSSGLSGGRAGDMMSVVDTRLQSNNMNRSVNNFQPMASQMGLYDSNTTEALRPSSSGRNTFGMRANNFDQNANFINSQAESETPSQWNPGSGFYTPHGQEAVKQHISIGNYQALESIRHQQQMLQQQMLQQPMQQQPIQQQPMQQQQMQLQTIQHQHMQQQPIQQQALNHTAPQLNDAHADSFKTQGSYYVDPNSTSMQSAQNSGGGMNNNRRGRYSSSPNLHYPTGQITNSGTVPHSTTSQMAGVAAENQGQVHDRVHGQKSNTSRMIVMNNPNNVSRSSASFVRPQYENDVSSGIHQAQLYNRHKHSMKHMGAGGGGEGAAINRSQQQLVNSIHGRAGQQFGNMQSQGGEMYGKPDMQQFQSVPERSSPQAGGEPDDGGTSGEEGGVTYIPMSWGELLGGGKDGLQKMQVVMSPPGSDSPNQNRQLRLAFGDQQVTTQPGEVPLKILSINPIEGYEMGPVAELHADRSGVTEITSPNEAVEIKANAAYGSDPQVLLANSQISRRPESKPAVASGVSYIPRYSKPLVSNSIPIQTGSSLGYTNYNPVTSTAVRRSGFAGTKFY